MPPGSYYRDQFLSDVRLSSGEHSGAAVTTVVPGAAGLRTFIFHMHFSGNNIAVSAADMAIDLGTMGAHFKCRIPLSGHQTIEVNFGDYPLIVSAGQGVSIATFSPWLGQCSGTFQWVQAA